jgi:alpha-tubulin suppressor-like RCC1 family protein
MSWLLGALAAVVHAVSLTPAIAPAARTIVAGTPGVTTTLRGHVRWDGPRVLLRGEITVVEGGTLTIAAGTTVEAQPGARLHIARDSRIDARGTLLQPIVFRCAGSTQSGCWRGLVIDGFAPVNRGAPTGPAARDVGAAGCREAVVNGERYGGCDAEDSSGVLQYVRVQSASEGLELRGVGRRTIVRDVQVHAALGNGLTISGGTARLRYVLLTASAQFGLRWRYGWQGDAQFVVVQQNPSQSAGGIHGSNGETEADAGATPRSAPTLSNVTVITSSAPTNPYAASGPRALLLDAGTAGSLRNLLIARGPVALDVDGAAACQQLAQGTLSLDRVVVLSVGSAGDGDADPAECSSVGTSPGAEAAHLARPGATVVIDPSLSAATAALLSDEDLALPDLRTRSSASAIVAASALPPAGFEFDGVTYAAGVAPATPARNNIPWYAGWAVGGAPSLPTPATVLVRVTSTLLGQVQGQRVSLQPIGVSALTGVDGARLFADVPAGPVTVALDGQPAGCLPATPRAVLLGAAAVDTIAFELSCAPAPEVALDAGFAHTCALDRLGSAYCWGAGGAGQLGTGTTDSSRVPVAVVGGRSYAAISTANNHACAIDATRTLYCWGSNAQGQLALGAGVSGALVPTAVPTPLRFTKISVGAEHSCGVSENGAAYCWGSGNDGKLGNASFSPQPAPALVFGGLSWQSVAAGGAHSCGVTTAGVVYCWGTNVTGALGNAAIAQSPVPVPVQVPAGQTFREVVAGESQTCALTVSGAAYCWGTNVVGQLGNGSVTNATAATLVASAANWSAIGMGAEPTFLGHVCGADVGGVVRCWGLGNVGQLGREATESCFYLQPWPCALTPGVVPSLGAAVRAVTGGRHSCALLFAGSIWCWGENGAGQLGDGTSLGRAAPALVSGSIQWPSAPSP